MGSIRSAEWGEQMNQSLVHHCQARNRSVLRAGSKSGQYSNAVINITTATGGLLAGFRNPEIPGSGFPIQPYDRGPWSKAVVRHASYEHGASGYLFARKAHNTGWRPLS